MKKSLIYYKAQIAVLESGLITYGEKLEILRVLMRDEDLELFSEERAEEKEKCVESGDTCASA